MHQLTRLSDVARRAVPSAIAPSCLHSVLLREDNELTCGRRALVSLQAREAVPVIRRELNVFIWRPRVVGVGSDAIVRAHTGLDNIGACNSAAV